MRRLQLYYVYLDVVLGPYDTEEIDTLTQLQQSAKEHGYQVYTVLAYSYKGAVRKYKKFQRKAEAIRREIG